MLRSSDELDRLAGEVGVELQAAGLSEAAQRLTDVRNGTFTTGSEWLGELRGAAQTIRRGYKLPRELDRKLRQLLAPSFPERVVIRQLWLGILTGTILAILGAAMVALVTAKDLNRHAPVWMAAAVVLIALLWISVRRVSECPGCGSRMRRLSPEWCPYCGTHVSTGTTGPQVAARPTTPAPSILRCPTCGNPPGGRSRRGTPQPSEGHFCSSCGARLPEG